jgi:hypothetical protein
MVADGVGHAALAELPVRTDYCCAVLAGPHCECVVPGRRESYRTRRQTLMPMLPQHPADSSINVMIQ